MSRWNSHSFAMPSPSTHAPPGGRAAPGRHARRRDRSALDRSLTAGSSAADRQAGATTLEYIVLIAVLVLGLVAAVSTFRADTATAADNVADELVRVAAGDISQARTSSETPDDRASDDSPTSHPASPAEVTLGNAHHTLVERPTVFHRGADTARPGERLTPDQIDAPGDTLDPALSVGIGVETWTLDDRAWRGGEIVYADGTTLSGDVLGHRDVGSSFGAGLDPRTGDATFGLEAQGEVYAAHVGLARSEIARPGDSEITLDRRGDLYLGRIKGKAIIGYSQTEDERFFGLDIEASAESVAFEGDIGFSISTLDMLEVATGNTGNKYVDFVVGLAPWNLLGAGDTLHAVATQNDGIRDALADARLGASCKVTVAGPSVGGRLTAGGYQNRNTGAIGGRVGAKLNAGKVGLGISCDTNIQL